MLRAFTTSWSYVINEKGNALRMTVEGYGSCVPQEVLQQMLNNLSDEKKKALSKNCDEIQDIVY